MKYTLLLLIFINIFCNIETNTADPRSSKDIDFSKWNGLFLEEFFVQSTTGQLFSVGEAWVEKAWRNNSDRSVHLTPTGVSRLVIWTRFFLEKDTLLAYPEAQSPIGVKYEAVSIFCRHTDSKLFDNAHRYVESSFLEIQKAKDKRAELHILLSAKDAEFYRLSSIKIDSLNWASFSTLQTPYGQFDDVYIIRSEDYGNFHHRSNIVKQLYWSKTSGLIRYDKNDSVYWELVNKY